MGACCGCVTIEQSTVGVVEYFGKYDRMIYPGFNCINCCFESVHSRPSLMLHTSNMNVETITKDQLSVNIRVGLQYKINIDNIEYVKKGKNKKNVELEAFSEKSVLVNKKDFPSYQNANIPIPSYDNAVYNATYLTNSIGSQMGQVINSYFRANSRNHTLEELFLSKNNLSYELQDLLNEEVHKYGYIVEAVYIEDIDPPANVKATMNAVLEAKNKREAMVTNAQAEREAMILRAEAEQKTMIMKAEALAETRRLEGEGLAKQRQALAEGLTQSLKSLCGENATVSVEESTKTIIKMQYIDMLNTAAHNGKNVFVMRCDPAGVSNIGDQLENALITANNVG